MTTDKTRTRAITDKHSETAGLSELADYYNELFEYARQLARELTAMKKIANNCVQINEMQAVNFAKCQAELAEARKERDLAIAHDTQPYPTSDAYEQVCRVAKEQRERAEKAESMLTYISDTPMAELQETKAEVERSRDEALEEAPPAPAEPKFVEQMDHRSVAVIRIDDLERRLRAAEAECARLQIACVNLLYAWDNKTPLAWQPDKHREILEHLRAVLNTARKP